MSNFDRLTEYLDWLPQAGVPVRECIVTKDHEELFRYTGTAGRDKDLYFMFSVTKLVTCAAALQLVERGKLGLEDPVERYLPEYAFLWVENGEKRRAARRGMTVENLFTMTGGLSYDLRAPGILALRDREGVTARQAAAVFIQQPLKTHPGEHYCYSLCHDVLAAVVESVSGLRFGDYVAESIFQPLGLEDSGFQLTEERRKRLNPFYFYDNGRNTSEETLPVNEFILSPGFESGGAGLISSARDMGTFVDALANGGQGANGARVLKDSTVAMMGINRLSPEQLADFHDKPKYYGYGWGLCGRVHMEPRISGSTWSPGFPGPGVRRGNLAGAARPAPTPWRTGKTGWPYSSPPTSAAVSTPTSGYTP